MSRPGQVCFHISASVCRCAVPCQMMTGSWQNYTCLDRSQIVHICWSCRQQWQTQMDNQGLQHGCQLIKKVSSGLSEPGCKCCMYVYCTTTGRPKAQKHNNAANVKGTLIHVGSRSGYNLCTPKWLRNLLKSSVCIQTHITAVTFKSHAVQQHKCVTFHTDKTYRWWRKCIGKSLSLMVIDPTISTVKSLLNRQNCSQFI